MNLFAPLEANHLERVKPLAARMRPNTLAEFVGQSHIIDDAVFRRRWQSRTGCGSLILFGPPGCGKTTLARLIAQETGSVFRQLNAVSTGVKEIREMLEAARDEVAAGGPRTTLLIDELHRLHRGQQEVMLREIEEGIIGFIGVTTSNPFFAVSSALVSRSQVLELKPLNPEDLVVLLQRAVVDEVRGLGAQQVTVEPGVLDYVANLSDGDARRALQTLEWSVTARSADQDPVTIPVVRSVVQRKAGAFDRSGEEHYDLASALIKSIRGSDADAGIYWLARMLEAGEDVRFLCRRLVILASEDIGNADPHALLVATSAWQACEYVGLPECQFALAQAVTYLACAPKSNAAAAAIGAARRDVRESAILPVPKQLRDAHSASSRRRGHGQGYQSPHESTSDSVPPDYYGVDRQYYVPPRSDRFAVDHDPPPDFKRQ